MSNKEFLKEVKAGDVLVRALTGGGYTTYNLVEVENVDDKSIYIEGADGDYTDDSVYRFLRSNGRSVNNYIPGFSSTLIRIATEEDKSKDEEDIIPWIKKDQ